MAGEGKSGSRLGNVAWNEASPELATALAIIQFERSDQLELCDGLELVADQLPDQVDFSLYESIHEKLRRNLPIYHLNEEALFERVRGHTSSWVDTSSVLECVRREHAIHNCYADELYENLDVLRAGNDIRNPSTIGYMLRFCFDSLRRHIVWEDMTLMPLASTILTTDDLAELSETVQKNRETIGLKIV
ncbi:MAG: hemerythrin domain-containing protein [Planctomycetaceae bacterium]|nr:hemerythrin domain-containing protein [Planctomycetaceae bacterium]